MLMRDGAFSPAFIAAARLCITAIVFIVLQLMSRRDTRAMALPPIYRNIWLYIAAAAICGNLLIYAIGLRFTTAGATAVINPVNAIATVLLAALLLGERLTARKILGMLLAITGVLLVVFHKSAVSDLFSAHNVLGNLLEVLASAIWAFYAIGQTKLQQQGGRQILLPIFTIAALLSLLLLPVTGRPILHIPRVVDWLVLSGLGAICTALAYWLFAAGLRRIATSEGAMFSVLVPPCALLLAHWCLGEPLHPHMLTGLALVLSGLFCILWHREHSPLRVKRVGHIAKSDMPKIRPAINDIRE